MTDLYDALTSCFVDERIYHELSLIARIIDANRVVVIVTILVREPEGERC
jgi:hypothetical protein